MIHERFSSPDYFIANPPLKPKEDIARYVESQGILVPKRSSTLKEVLASGRDFIIRSEHPQDYSGASGITESLVIKIDEIEKAKLKAQKLPDGIDWYKEDGKSGLSLYDFGNSIIANLDRFGQGKIENAIKKLSGPFIKLYSDLINEKPTDVENKIGFSYWELIHGKTQVVVADSAIENKYHIFQNDISGLSRFYYNYSVYENGIEQKSVTFGKDQSGIDNPLELISFYESVRNLPLFDSNNCPTIEMVSDKNETYFLQYLKGRDFKPVEFVLDKPLGKKQVEASFVRGATGPNGIVCDTKFWYSASGLDVELEDEDASFDFHWNSVFSELMTPRRKVQFSIANDFNHFIMKTIDTHLQKSKLFKPQVSILLTDENFLKIFPEFKRPSRWRQKDTNTFLKRLGVTEYEDFRAKLHVVSDGRRAIVKRLTN